jgi:histidine triad (HIT) family protein
MLTEEQALEIKKQIIKQIQENFPEDKKALAESQIQDMNSKELEEFLKNNNLIISKDKTNGNKEVEQCVFCSIVSGGIASYKIDENKNVLAVLEINPISKAHTLIIPKKHSNKITKTISSFAEKISKKIKKKFKPKDVIISSSNLFGHEILNIIPVYKDETINSKRYKAESEELQDVQKKFEKKERTLKKPKPEKIKEKIWLPKRIP